MCLLLMLRCDRRRYGSTPLHRAAGARQPKLLAQVLASMDPSALDVCGTSNPPLFGGTALHSAAGAGDAGAYEVLLKAGASFGMQDDQGRLAVDLAPGNVKPELERLEAKFHESGGAVSMSSVSLQFFDLLLVHCLSRLASSLDSHRGEEEGEERKEEQAEEEGCFGKRWRLIPISFVCWTTHSPQHTLHNTAHVSCSAAAQLTLALTLKALALKSPGNNRVYAAVNSRAYPTDSSRFKTPWPQPAGTYSALPAGCTQVSALSAATGSSLSHRESGCHVYRASSGGWRAQSFFPYIRWLIACP